MSSFVLTACNVEASGHYIASLVSFDEISLLDELVESLCGLNVIELYIHVSADSLYLPLGLKQILLP